MIHANETIWNWILELPAFYSSFYLNTAASLQRATGLPFGGFIEPFLEPMETNSGDTLASSVGRCRGCGAYVNAYNSFLRTGWVCSLCQALNEFSDGCTARYMGGVDHRDTLPELGGNVVDLHVDVDEEVG